MTAEEHPAGFPEGGAPVNEDQPVVITGIDERVDRETIRTGLSHQDHELVWNERGASTASVGRRVWTVTPRIGVWVPAGTVHSVRLPAGTWYRAARFSVWATPKTPQWLRPFGVEITELLRLLLVRLSDTGLSPQSRSLNEQMVIDLLTPSPHEITVHLPDAAVLAPLVEAVTAHPSDRHSLDEWAARLGVSGRTVGRVLQARTGLGFTDWVASVRMQRAIELIVAGERLEDVAVDVGYQSPSAFGAAFKRATGLTPGSFRPET